MRRLLLILTVLVSVGWAIPGRAQGWDAASLARGWAHQDKDGSFTFYDEFSAALQTWARDGGLQLSTPLGQMPVVPEKWVIDPHNNHWVISGVTLIQVSHTGEILHTSTLPAEVADICWDTWGFVLSYRTPEPYLEKRDFKNGALLWSFGSKPVSGGGSPDANTRPVVMDDEGNVLMADGNSLALSVIQGATGRKVSEASFHLSNGGPAPNLEGPAVDRGPLVYWGGNGVVFAVVKAAQVPAGLKGASKGAVLARLELATGQVDFLPTGLSDAHTLIGIYDSSAVFARPEGGLELLKIK